jgi:hypothetical protein
MEAWRVCRLLVADSHHFDEGQDPNPVRNPHLSDADPQLIIQFHTRIRLKIQFLEAVH